MIFSIISGGLLLSVIFSIKISLSFSTTSTGTLSGFKYNGLLATTCIANFLAASIATLFSSSDSTASSPPPPSLGSTSTSTKAADVPQVEFGARPWTYPAITEREEGVVPIVTMESSWIFSRMDSTASLRHSDNSLPVVMDWVLARKVGMSTMSPPSTAAAAASAISCTNPVNTSLRLAKSVSLATLTSTPLLPPSQLSIQTPTKPSNASLPATFDPIF
mmetsp:Transcript_15314/g.33094  ORF Transcript_15314/g.33094 Transcript_15314/m.33094 type:complete len:219 (+) Transcript_15314:173-829(+)